MRTFYEKKTGIRNLEKPFAHMALTHHNHDNQQRSMDVDDNSDQGKKENLFISWIIDNAATQHVVNDKRVFKNFKTEVEQNYIISANDNEDANILIEGRGTIIVKFPPNGEIVTLDIRCTVCVKSNRKFTVST